MNTKSSLSLRSEERVGTRRCVKFVLTLAPLALMGCQVTTAPLDAGTLTVPGGYHLARMTPGHRAHLELSGTERVPCRDCHSLADAGFTAPPVSICASCHEAQQRQHHPWPVDAGVSMNCLTCHVFRAEAAPVRFEKWGCLNCHREAQGARAPIGVHVENCASCHRPHDAPFTASGECGSCHEVSVTHGAKGGTLAETCMACHPPHTPANVASQQCVACHAKPTMKVPARVSPQALFSGGHEGCGSCHLAHRFQKSAVKQCSSCHQNRLVLAPDSHETCDSCHPPHQPRAQAKPCEQCHERVAATNTHPPPREGQKCIGCHVPHPKDPGPVAAPCTTCHQEPHFTGEMVHAASLSCESCHAPHTGAPKREVLCVSCHKQQLTAVKVNRGHANCNDCHAGLPHGEPTEPKACLSCHEDKVPPQKGHPECASCHASHSAAITKTCASCHLTPTSPLPGLHAVQKHRDCATCHAPHTPEPPRSAPTCRSCHQRLPPSTHPTPPTQCTGCHLFATQP